MATIKKQWSSGTGEVTITYNGSGNGQITISSDGNNLYEARSMQIVVQTTAGSPQQTKTVNISQAARVRTDISNAIVTAVNQTYSGSALTPAPTVKLNGVTIPSTGYDVVYSNNTNAGTATVTVTGKGDYTGTASGTFTIAKANPTYTAPTAKTLTYSRSAQAVLNAGSTNHGTIQYSSNGTSWSTSIPTKTNAGSYTVYWKLIGDSNHNDIASTSIDVTIAKATPVVATAPSKRSNLTYSGSAQNLLSGGSMKHSSSDSTSVAGTFTYAQGTNAGTYNSLTWSFVPTDSTNYNSASGTVSGSVSIAKASRTLSFPNAYVVLAPSGNITKTATPSAGSGDGAITYSIGSTTYATINSSSGKVTAKTTEGNTTVTATIAEGTNYLGATATYTLYVFATTHNYEYTASAKSLTLPPGSYKLQVWGAQGGSNAADSDYDITAKAGGKGGYSEGQLTVASETPVKIYVGGQGGSSAGGYNGGGSTTGESSYNSDNVLGISKMGGGGGASDIRLSDDTLLSRMIVAGGGSGGAMCYKRVTTESTQTVFDAASTSLVLNYGYNHYILKNVPVIPNKTYRIINKGSDKGTELVPSNYSPNYLLANGTIGSSSSFIYSTDYIPCNSGDNVTWKYSSGYTNNSICLVLYDASKNVVSYRAMNNSAGYRTFTITESGVAYIRASFKADYIDNAEVVINGVSAWKPESTTREYTFAFWHYFCANYHAGYDGTDRIGSSSYDMTFVSPNGANYMDIYMYKEREGDISSELNNLNIEVEHDEITSSITETREEQAGYVGGGTTGAAYSSTYQGKQNAAGSGGSFGQGANQTTTSYRYASGAGGGGWYGGGGGQKSNSSMTYCKYSGGGSGFVNTSANAQYRPSGYTGLQLDSGSTKDGTQTFVSPSGTNETGHSGNGYARITRL